MFDPISNCRWQGMPGIFHNEDWSLFPWSINRLGRLCGGDAAADRVVGKGQRGLCLVLVVCRGGHEEGWKGRVVSRLVQGQTQAAEGGVSERKGLLWRQDDAMPAQPPLASPSAPLPPIIALRLTVTLLRASICPRTRWEPRLARVTATVSPALLHRRPSEWFTSSVPVKWKRHRSVDGPARGAVSNQRLIRAGSSRVECSLIRSVIQSSFGIQGWFGRSRGFF